MLIDGMGDIVITNDGATILQQMDMSTRPAKMMVEIAKTQDAEVGDGTTSAVVIAGELLKNAETSSAGTFTRPLLRRGTGQAAAKSLEILSPGSRSP